MKTIDPALISQFNDSLTVKNQFLKDEGLMGKLQQICDVCLNVYRTGHKILVAGNGGSAADAQHFAGELISRFYYDRPALPAIALTTDTSILTAVGNDYGYEQVFSRQIKGLGQEQDVFIGISTSGNSPNILEAIRVAKEKKMITVGLTGASGGKMMTECDWCLNVPSNETPRIQECHLLLEHLICAYIEKKMFPK